MKRQILISGVGGQGIVLLGRILAEAALFKGLSVVASETHGMAQRGGIVVSHIKIGGFVSPLIKVGSADILFALKQECVGLYRHYSSPEGFILCNSPYPDKEEDKRTLCFDAETMALEAYNPKAVNIAMLGFAFSKRAADRGLNLLCSFSDVQKAIIDRFTNNKDTLERTLALLNRSRDAL